MKINEKPGYRFEGSREAVKKAAEALEVHGLVIVENYLDVDSVHRISRRVRPLLENVQKLAKSISPDNPQHEYDDYLLTLGGRGYEETYKLSEKTGKAIVSIRRQEDRGMIDIFCIDRMFPDLAEDFSQIQESWINESAAKASGENFRPANLNLYYNNSVANTRGFHVDSWNGHQLKAFIYLTDVTDDADGPHLYVRGSHRKKLLAALNKYANKVLSRKSTDCHIIDRKKVTKVIGKKGTFFASFQNGMHRGYPQADNHERIVLVQNYRAAGENNPKE